MTRPLTQGVKDQLKQIDESPMWETADLERMRMQVYALRDAYPMADIRLAQFLMETAMGVGQVLQHPDEELRDTLAGYQTGLAMLASAVSRKARGKPEI